MKSKIVGLLAFGLLGAPVASNAAVSFSDLVITSSSVSFNITGDMTSYTSPALYEDYFSILYSGPVWVGTSGQFSSNVWSTSPFTSVAFSDSGNTGNFGGVNNYTFSIFMDPLNLAVATNQRVTVNWGAAYLNPALSGQIQFVWGFGDDAVNYSVLETFTTWGTETAVPEPGSIALLGLGLLGIGLTRRKAA